MIINDGDQSALGELTNRVLLLQKTDEEKEMKEKLMKKEELQSIIKDKSIVESEPEDPDMQHRLYRLYRSLTPIRPQNPLIVGYNILVMMVILFYLMQFPLILGFGQIVWRDLSTSMLPLMIIFYVILLVDVFLTPLKMEYRDGLLIKDTRILVKDYLKRNFWIDVVGLMAVLVPMIFRSYYAVNLLKIFFLPKVLILNQLDDKVVKVLIFQARIKTIYLIGRLVIFMIMIAHYIGIGFYMVAHYIYSTNYYGPNTPNITWLYNAQAYSQIILLLDWKAQYAYTMYFSIGMTTTIAYGDITPLNPIQTLYIVFALVINTIAFGYILSEILRVLIEGFYAQFDKNNIKYSMQNLLVTRNITHKLRQSIRAHMQQIAKQQIYRDRPTQRQVISSLPFNLQIALSSQIYQQFIQNLKLSLDPFFTDKNRNTRFIQKILLEITQSRYLVGDLIYKEQEAHLEEFNNHRVYFIKDKEQINDVFFGVGKSPLINLQTHGIENQHDYMIFYNYKTYFGEVQFLTGTPRSNWVISKNNILLYELSRNSLLRNFRFASKKELQHFFELKQTVSDSYCYICFNRHNFKNCNRATFIPNILEAIERIDQQYKMRRRHNAQIVDMRTQKRNQSVKTNALKVYKRYSNHRDKRILQKSKIRLLASSKHYRRIYYQDECQNDNNDHYDDSSSGSSEDLDYLIQQTKILIDNLDKVGNCNDEDHENHFFQYQFDSYYHFKGYKKDDNYQNVIGRFMAGIK